MKTRILVVSLAAYLSSLACSSESQPGPSGVAGASGAGATAGSQPQSTAGAPSGVAGAATGGATNGGASVAGAAGSGSAGAPQAGAVSFGGASGTAGGPGLAGAAGNGGAAGVGGAVGVAGALSVATALDGVRVDDACSETKVDTSVGAVCQHVTLTTSGGSKYAKTVSIGGTTGTTYDVTLRIRGVVEPTRITGGTRSDTSTFRYRDLDWRKVAYTVGGAVSDSTDADYTQWHIGVESPKADYYLNDYQKTGHYIFLLDYQVTIPMAANTKVTVDGIDRNERQIVNYEKYAPDGIPGSMNFGQFIQTNVVSVKPR